MDYQPFIKKPREVSGLDINIEVKAASKIITRYYIFRNFSIVRSMGYAGSNPYDNVKGFVNEDNIYIDCNSIVCVPNGIIRRNYFKRTKYFGNSQINVSKEGYVEVIDNIIEYVTSDTAPSNITTDKPAGIFIPKSGKIKGNTINMNGFAWAGLLTWSEEPNSTDIEDNIINGAESSGSTILIMGSKTGNFKNNKTKDTGTNAISNLHSSTPDLISCGYNGKGALWNSYADPSTYETFGNNGDICIDTENGITYIKVGGTWKNLSSSLS